MQKSIRYYITSAGDEPTVRSVRVAMNAAQRAERGETVIAGSGESAAEPRRSTAGRVRRLVKGAMDRRAHRG